MTEFISRLVQDVMDGGDPDKLLEEPFHYKLKTGHLGVTNSNLRTTVETLNAFMRKVELDSIATKSFNHVIETILDSLTSKDNY